jgi:hypothetical protein
MVSIGRPVRVDRLSRRTTVPISREAHIEMRVRLEGRCFSTTKEGCPCPPEIANVAAFDRRRVGHTIGDVPASPHFPRFQELSVSEELAFAEQAPRLSPV